MRWTKMSIPRDIYEMAEEGAKLKGCTAEEFIFEALEKAIEEEKSRRAK